MAKMLEKMAFIIIIAFGLFGAFVLSVVLHEYSHVSDFNGIAENGQVCGLVLPQNASYLLNADAGYYSFSYEKNNTAQVQSIEKYTEYKAYSIALLVLMIFFISSLIVFRKFYFKPSIPSSEALYYYNKDLANQREFIATKA